MTEMREPVIVDAVRTPVGRRGGMLKDWHPADLLANTLEALVERTGIDPGMFDDVIAGCVRQVEEQSINIARNAVLGAGFPEAVPGTTIDRQCGSSQQAVHFAAQGVMSGAYEAVIACGVESMTRVPLGEAFEGNKPGPYYGERATRRYDDGLVNQGISANLVAKKWNLSREELDEYSLRSHRRAARATEEGRFEGQIVPVPVEREDGSVEKVAKDEGIRYDASLEKMSTLKPVFDPEGVITAANSSQISDAAAALLILERGTAERLGLKPRARFVSFSVVGTDPILMLTGPIPATREALERAGLDLEDIDLFEVNEAFASVVLAWQREIGADLEKTNVNGGSIAIGHPVGSTGARLMTVLLNELERTGGRYGLQAICEGGGTANGTIIERLD
jgi:acetyl-CoA acyltransferase